MRPHTTIVCLFSASIAILLGPQPRNAAAEIFVVDQGTGMVGSYTISGETVNDSLIDGLVRGVGIAIQDDHLFSVQDVPSNGLVYENTSTGMPISIPLISGLPDPYGIAVSGTDIFITNAGIGTVGEYTTSGAVVNASLITGSERVNDFETLTFRI